MANELRPIRSEADHEAAMAEIADLWGAEDGTPQGDRLELLATLVDAYEAQHHPIDPPDPVEAILFRMEQRGLTRRQLEPMIGSRGRVSEILGRKRDLTLEMIRRLHDGLGIPAEILIRPTTNQPADLVTTG